MSMFHVFFVMVVGLFWVKFLLAGSGKRQDEEVCCIAGGEGLYSSCYAG